MSSSFFAKKNPIQIGLFEITLMTSNLLKITDLESKKPIEDLQS
jgi:hypothetical protein